MQEQHNRVQGARLRVQNKKFTIYRGVNTIGRNKSAVVDLKNLNVSQYHAVIMIIDDAQHFISDLNSSNGTYLSGTKLIPFKLYELQDEAKIRFGDVDGLYLKMPNENSAIHSETQSMEMTQNVSQAFYVANTQLLLDDSALNQTMRNKSQQLIVSETATQDIHEMATQVVEYPPMIVDKIADDNVSHNVLEEMVISDIHNDETQVVVPEETPSTSKESENIHEMVTQAVILPKQVCNRPEENIHEMQTQVVTYREKIDRFGRKEDENKNPQSVAAANDTNASVIQDSLIEETVIEESVIEERPTDRQETNTDENSNDSIDFLTIDKPPDQTQREVHIPTSESNVASLTPSDTEDIRPGKRSVRRLSSSEDLTHVENKCNSDSETDVEDVDVERLKRKPLRKLGSPKSDAQKKPVNSDSETDAEDDREQPLPATQSDEIIKPKILSKKPTLDSDSDTDVEGDKENQPATEAAQDADSNATEILNDTDYIPATQDAFANEFQYQSLKQPNRGSQNASSEESFKLGLTELMIDENDLSLEQSNKEKEESHVADTKEEADDLYMLPTQKVHDENAVKKSNERLFLALNRDSKQAGSSTVSEPVVNADEANEDFYRADTQKIAKETCNKMHRINIEQNLSKESPAATADGKEDEEDDLYMLPTQKLQSSEHLFLAANRDLKQAGSSTALSKPVVNADDFYAADTQKLTKERGNEIENSAIPIEREADDDFYMMSTQRIANTEPQEKREENIYAMATQEIIPVPACSKIAVTEDADDELYMMPTQVINEKDVKNGEIDDEEVYMAPTQVINEEDVENRRKNDDENFKVPQKFHFKKKLNLDGSLTSILGDKPGEMKQIHRPSVTMSKIKEHPDKDDAYLQPTQELHFTSRYSKENQPAEDPYTMEPQKISENQGINDNSKENKPEEDPYTMETQRTDQNHGMNDKIYVTETENQLFMMATQKIDIPPISNGSTSNETNAYSLDTQLLETNVSVPGLKRSGETRSDVPKSKRVKKSDIENLKKAIVTENRRECDKTVEQGHDQVETLSQIEAFIKTPLEPKNDTSSSSSRENLKDVQRELSENHKTLSQIEAFVKKPLVQVPTTNPEDKDDDRPETLSQIESFIRRPMELISGGNKNASPSRKTRGNLSLAKKSKSGPSKKSEEKEEASSSEKSLSTSHLDPDAVRSGIDHSFALLEAKSTKTRKSQRVSNVGEIKVAVTKNRRSMAISSVAELPEAKARKTATRKSRRGLNNNDDSALSENKISGNRKVGDAKNSACSDSDFSEPEVPAKTMRLSVRKGKEKTRDDSGGTPNIKAGQNRESKQHAEPITSRSASARSKTPKKNENAKSSDGDSSSLSSDAPLVTPSTRNRGRKVANEGDPDVSTPSTSKAKPGRPKGKSTLSSNDTGSYDGGNTSGSSNEPNLTTPSRRGRRAVQEEAALSTPERSKRKFKPKVVFTMLDSPLLESLIRQLGGSVVDSVHSSTVLVTEHVKRSQKLLTAVGQGKPVCSPDWIHACKKANEFLDPWDYILKDQEAESKWNFSLRNSISKAANEKLLSNYTVVLMVNNATDVLKGAIEACGGKCVKSPTKNTEGFLVVVASPENRTRYQKVKKQHPAATIVEPEAIFDGVLRQELRLGRHLLT